MNREYYERAVAKKIQQKRRAREVKLQRFLITLSVFTAVLFISVISVSHFAYANAETETLPRTKYYKSIMIYNGDTLETIAEQYMSDEYSSTSQYMYEISCMNYLTAETKLIAGNYIIIPYYADVVDTVNTTDTVSIQVACK